MSEENLEKIIAQQTTTIQNLTDEIKLLREQVAYLTQKALWQVIGTNAAKRPAKPV